METGRAGRGASSDGLRTDEAGRRAPTPPGSPGDAMVCQHHSHSNFPLQDNTSVVLVGVGEGYTGANLEHTKLGAPTDSCRRTMSREGTHT